MARNAPMSKQMTGPAAFPRIETRTTPTQMLILISPTLRVAERMTTSTVEEGKASFWRRDERDS